MKAYNLNGMLLYPENEGPIDESLRFGEYIFSVKTVDLKKGIEQIETELLRLKRYFTNSHIKHNDEVKVVVDD